MRICDYCGKANKDTLQFCAGCGTALKDSVEAQAKPELTPMPKSRPRMLNAGSATIILLAYLVSIIICEFLLQSVPGTEETPRGIHILQRPNSTSNSMIALGLILDPVVGGFVIIIMSSLLIPKHLKDVSPVGAAWVLGQRKAIAKGLVIGLIIGVADEILAMIVNNHAVAKPIHQMMVTPGFPQTAWVIATLILAPPVEEMLFRGIVYGGYCKSFGPMWATIFTTFIFVVIHYPYYIYAPTNAIGIIVGALAILWCRLRWNAIGPAIAAHIGYNLVLDLVIIYRTW